jgi:hypothetical protein
MQSKEQALNIPKLIKKLDKKKEI